MSHPRCDRKVALRAWFMGVALVAAAGPVRAQSDGGGADASVPDAALPDATVPCGAVDALGLCQGTVRRVCSQGSLVEEDCRAVFGAGFTCELEPGLGAAVCMAVPTDAGPAVDAGLQADASLNSTPPVDDGAHCVKPAFGSPALLGAALWWVGPRRRRVTPRT